MLVYFCSRVCPPVYLMFDVASGSVSTTLTVMMGLLVLWCSGGSGDQNEQAHKSLLGVSPCSERRRYLCDELLLIPPPHAHTKARYQKIIRTLEIIGVSA